MAAANALAPALPGDDGTNIGDALAWALDAVLKTSPNRKVLVLLTDGDNAPAVPKPLDPLAAARLARELGVILHTIALGRPGGIARVREPVTNLPIPVAVDGPNLELLRSMAEEAGGRSFHATDVNGLAEVLHAIDALERSPVTGLVRTRYRDWYPAWLAGAAVLLTLDRLLAGGRLRRLP